MAETNLIYDKNIVLYIQMVLYCTMTNLIPVVFF